MVRRVTPYLFFSYLFCLVFCEAAEAQPEENVPAEWLTEAEASGFLSTPTYDETMAFLRRVEERMPGRVKVGAFGVSGEGRALPLVVVSKEGAFTPEAARGVGKPVVLIQSGIHAGEIDGKDASLMILRDLALGRRQELLEAATLLFVPIYNVDGHERISPHNRPNQDGPREGMGFRTTASGLDLNRDHMKLASPEARALVGLVNAWRPHLHVDNHVTDGSDHAWVMTTSWAEAPQAPAAVDAWLRAHMPVVEAATERAGHSSGPYVDLRDELDPAQGFSTSAGPPRFSTGYFALRNRPSILVETHSYKPYAARVLATRDFLLALLAEVGRDPAALRRAVEEAEARTVALGRPDAAPSEVAIGFRESAASDPIRFPIYDWTVAPSLVTGQPLLRYRSGQVREIEVPWYHRVEAEKALPRPRGYLVLPGWPAIEERLRGHGLRVERLTAPVELEVEAARVSAPDYAEASYQGLTRVEKVDVARGREQRRFPAGALWVPADQPDFEVAVQLLEPDAPDSLLAWGLLSSVFEGKEYIEPGVLDAWAEEQLNDPEVAAAWQAALRDEAFAKDGRARYLWWYRRHPSWDATQGLFPVFRVLQPPQLATEAWH
jgi:hypothetical protein